MSLDNHQIVTTQKTGKGVKLFDFLWFVLLIVAISLGLSENPESNEAAPGIFLIVIFGWLIPSMFKWWRYD